MKPDNVEELEPLSYLSLSDDVVNPDDAISNDSSDSAVVNPDYAERDPRGRYVRYNERLGKGSFKSVYMAFDEIDGIEVAWNCVKTRDVFQTYEEFENVHVEVNLLKQLEHENIIKLYDSWIDGTNNTVNMITELFTSGSLRQYRKKHTTVDMKAIKNWARQILQGLDYLHSQNPPIIHRDLKCDNIFINGHNGEIKIGDLGLATVKEHSNAKSIIGTPEFMAPELYEEDYNELVDIYSFGMCLLEMFTNEYPYSECNGVAEIYKKVTSGVKPASLGKVSDPGVKKFIEKCLVPASERLQAKELLKDSFLQCGTQKRPNLEPSKLPNKIHRTLSSSHSGTISMDIDPEYNLSLNTESNSEGPISPIIEFQRTHKNNKFRFSGSIEDVNTVELNGQIVDSSIGQIRYLHFNFSLINDTALDVATEMVEQLELEDDNITFIADFIDYMITRILPGWRKPPSGYDSSGSVLSSQDIPSVLLVNDPAPVGNPWQTIQSEHIQLSKTETNHSDDWVELNRSPSLAHYKGNQSQDLIPSEVIFDGFYDKNDKSNKFHADENGTNLIGYGSDMVYDDLYKEKFKFQGKECSGESMVVNDLQPTSSLSCSSSFSLSEKVQDFELNLEIDKIESQFQQCFQELLKQREEELKAARKRWTAKLKITV